MFQLGADMLSTKGDAMKTGFHFSSGSRGRANLVRRAWTIVRRFGLGSARFDRSLSEYVSVTSRFGCRPTLPVTAVILDRHPRLIRELSQDGADFAVHGDVHIDHRPLGRGDLSRHFARAVKLFHENSVNFTGFRAPYLRTNSDIPAVLAGLDFEYDSSLAVSWDVLSHQALPSLDWEEYRRVVSFYGAVDSRHYLSMPRFSGGLVEIPVSLPDDEILIDRLHIPERVGDVWGRILAETHRRGELFTLQLHPERLPV
ncbi:MAG: polysaccharide deacetylase family protein, partial [Dehalococcoidales bacterium]|nr:polysaccharide deacetylase family protein [Dehalococcoidales bacterium]